MNADDIFDVMEKNSKETRRRVTESVKREGNGTNIIDAFKKKQKSRSTGSIIYTPPPYSRKGAFVEDDVIDYIERLKGVQKYLQAGMPLEENIKVNLFDWMIEDTIESKLGEISSSSQREKALKQLTVKRETFMHFTILAYLGYLKSNYNDKIGALYKKLEEAQTPGNTAEVTDIFQIATLLKIYLTHPLATRQPKKERHVDLTLDGLKRIIQTYPDKESTTITEISDIMPEHSEKFKLIPDQMIKAMTMTYKLAFKTLLDAFKIYNPGVIRTEEDLKKNLRHQTADEVATGKINTISDLFAKYFSANPVERFKYYDAMHTKGTASENGKGKQPGIVEFLQKLEGMSQLPGSASRIPGYFGILVQRTSSRNRG